MSKPAHKFRVGDVVCHKRAFLRSMQWYTNVPMNGKITEVDDDKRPHGLCLATVEWNNGETGRINVNNITLYSERHKEPA